MCRSLLVALALQSLALPASAQEAEPEGALERLYAKAFGARPGLTSATLPARIDGRGTGELVARFHPGDPGSLELNGASVLALLRPVLAEEAAAGIGEAIDPGSWIGIVALGAMGIGATLDETQLQVVLTVAPELLPVTVRDAGNRPEEAADALGPATVSGYLTALGVGSVHWTDEATGVREEAGRVELKSALQVRGVVLEGMGVVDSESAEPVRRLYTRAVVDDPRRSVRYIAGDVLMPFIGFQDSLAMLGASAARNFALQPYKAFRPTGRYEFLLERPSLVRIYVNGALVDSLQLDAGTHDVRSLALGHGANTIQVEILDGNGAERRLEFTTAVSADLLGKGVHQFAYGVGFPATADPAEYAWDQPTASLAHRVGLTEGLTVHASATLGPSDQVVGVGSALASRYGNLAVDLGAGRVGDSTVMPAGRLRYDLVKLRSTSEVVRSMSLGVEYRPVGLGRFVENVGEAAPVTSTASFIQQLHGSTRATLDGVHRFGGDVALDDPSVGARLGVNGLIGRRVGLTLYGATEREPGGPTEWLTGVSLNSRLGRSNHSVRAAVDASSVAGLTESATWTHVDPTPGRVTQTSATLVNADATQAFSAASSLTGPRGSVGAAHAFTTEGWQNQPGSHTTEVYAASTLAFADGLWGVSAPIDGSFVLVGRQHQMKGQTLLLNPVEGRAPARADWLGAAVLPNLNPYTVTEVRLEAPDLPVGYELGEPTHYVVPGYQTGTAIRVGNEASILILGELLGSDGEPLGFTSGQVVDLDRPDAPPAILFTNGAGRFFVEGLRPGTYRLTPFGVGLGPVEFTLASEIEGLHRIGALTVPSTEPEGELGATWEPPAPALSESKSVVAVAPGPARVERARTARAPRVAAPRDLGQCLDDFVELPAPEPESCPLDPVADRVDLADED